MKIEDNVLISICNDDIINGTVVIPDGIISIGCAAFFGHKNLTSINVSKNNQNYKSIDGNLYSKDGATLIQYAIGKTDTTFIIPDGVVSIYDYAFEDCISLINVTIPDSVRYICYGAFLNCANLTSVTFGNGVTSIGDWAFECCTNLTGITIPNSVTYIGEYAFSHCENLTSITIPDSVTSIGVCAFYACKHLIKPTEALKTNSSIRAVKGFRINSNGQLQCQDFIYEPLKEYEETMAVLCKRGFHACLNGLGVFNYYVGNGVAYYEVELSGVTAESGNDSKICAKKIKLLKRLTVSEAANFRSECIS